MNTEYGLVLSVLKYKNLLNVLTKFNGSDFSIPEYRNYFNFIKEHFQKYNEIPTQKTMEDQFKTPFDLPEQLEKEQFYIDKILDKNLRENLIGVLKGTGQKIVGEEDIHKTLETLNASLRGLKTNNSNIISDNIGRDAQKRMDRYLENKKRGNILMYGWQLSEGQTESQLDTESPLVGGRLYLIQARPGVGKTFLICTVAGKLALKGIKSLFISKEMSSPEILERVDAFTCGISYSRLKKGSMSDYEEEKFKTYLAQMEGKEMMEVVFPKDCTQTTIRQLIELHQPNVVFVDYLQLIKDAENNKDKRNQMATIIYDLKQYSQIYKIPIVVISATNREGVKNGNPNLENISESDSIGYAIDTLFSLTQSEEDELQNIMKLICNKNRHGKRYTQEFIWDIDSSRIVEKNG